MFRYFWWVQKCSLTLHLRKSLTHRPTDSKNEASNAEGGEAGKAVTPKTGKNATKKDSAVVSANTKTGTPSSKRTRAPLNTGKKEADVRKQYSSLSRQLIKDYPSRESFLWAQGKFVRNDTRFYTGKDEVLQFMQNECSMIEHRTFSDIEAQEFEKMCLEKDDTTEFRAKYLTHQQKSKRLMILAIANEASNSLSKYLNDLAKEKDLGKDKPETAPDPIETKNYTVDELKNVHQFLFSDLRRLNWKLVSGPEEVDPYRQFVIGEHTAFIFKGGDDFILTPPTTPTQDQNANLDSTILIDGLDQEKSTSATPTNTVENSSAKKRTNSSQVEPANKRQRGTH